MSDDDFVPGLVRYWCKQCYAVFVKQHTKCPICYLLEKVDLP
jgi:hypothetical protein